MSALVLSESFKNSTKDQIQAMNARVTSMSEEELEQFLNNIDPDSMGFDGAEGIHVEEGDE